MSADWKTLCREADLPFTGDAIRVDCGRDRSHTLTVDASRGNVIRLWSNVVRARNAPSAVEVWKINRYRELVGFKVVGQGRVIGESWIPWIEVTAEEWKTHVYTLARACDRLEYLWTGKDVE